MKTITLVLSAALVIAAIHFTSFEGQPKPRPLRPVEVTAVPLLQPSGASLSSQNDDGMTNPRARAELEFLQTRDPATNTVPRERLWAATRQAHLASRAPGGERFLSPFGPFDERGPNNIGGRTRVVVWDPDLKNRVWAGAISGGLWYTSDITQDGAPWQSVDDFWDNIAVSALAYDPGTSGPGRIWYAGTGEGIYTGSYSLRGAGIFKSTDGGASWSLLPSTESNASFYYVQKIVVTSSGAVLAATRDGIQRSSDGGASWTKVLGQTGATNVSVTDSANDLEIAANGDIYAGMGLGNPCDGVYKSTAAQSGLAWVKLTLPGGCDYRRVEVATAPSAAGTVYVATQSAAAGSINHIFRSDDGGAAWSEVNVPSNAGTIAWYAMTLAVDPNNPATAWAGVVRMFRTTDSGLSWSQEATALHVDHHAVAYRSGSSTEIAFGNDGGIYYTSNANSATVAVTDRNDGYNVTQYYAGDIHPGAFSDILIGGTQDNGTHLFDSAGIDAVDHVLGGDGGFTNIDQTDSSVVIASTQNGRYYLSTNGGVSFGGQFLNVSAGGAPIFINPSDFDDINNILFGHYSTSAIFRCQNVGTGPISCATVPVPGLTTHSFAFTVSPYTSSTISTLYFGTLTGQIFKYDATVSGGVVVGETITELNSATLPSGAVSSIAVGASENQLLVTFSNYGVDSVWESTDGGGSWFDKDDNSTLPDTPVHWAVYDPDNNDRVLLGTEVGLWGTDSIFGDGGTPAWERDTSVPLTRVDQLQYRPADGTVMAITHGRGMWTGRFQSIDSDGDGVADNADNCTLVANPDQRDTNGDSIGNDCDADVAEPNDCLVNFLDLDVYKANFFAAGDLDTDNNGDGQTNFADLTIVKAYFFGPPGPSALGCN